MAENPPKKSKVVRQFLDMDMDTFVYAMSFLPFDELIICKRVSRTLNKHATSAITFLTKFSLPRADRRKSDCGLEIFISGIKSRRLLELDLLGGGWCVGDEFCFTVQYIEVVSEKFPKLQFLYFPTNRTWSQQDSNHILRTISKNLPCLRTLYIVAYNQYAVDHKSDLSLLSSLKFLNEIDFSGHDSLDGLAELLSKRPTLSTISLEVQRLDPDELYKLSCSQFTQVTHFSLMLDAQHEQMIKILPRTFPCLQKLYLQADLSENTKSLRGILSMKELRELSLGHGSLADSSLNNSFSGGDVYPQIEEFIPLWGLSDSALVAMAQVLPNLKTLGLCGSESEITEHGMRTAAKYLVGVEKLVIDDTETKFITRPTLEKLCRQRVFPNLKCIEIGDCLFDESSFLWVEM